MGEEGGTCSSLLPYTWGRRLGSTNLFLPVIYGIRNAPRANRTLNATHPHRNTNVYLYLSLLQMVKKFHIGEKKRNTFMCMAEKESGRKLRQTNYVTELVMWGVGKPSSDCSTGQTGFQYCLCGAARTPGRKLSKTQRAKAQRTCGPVTLWMTCLTISTKEVFLENNQKPLEHSSTLCEINIQKVSFFQAKMS